MGTIYQPTYLCKKTGKQKKVKTYWFRYQRDHVERKVNLGVRCKRAAQSMVRDILRDLDRKEANLVDPFEKHRATPIADHLADFEPRFRAKGVTPRYSAERMGFLRAVSATTSRLSFPK